MVVSFEGLMAPRNSRKDQKSVKPKKRRTRRMKSHEASIKKI